jgi:Flp pilus assembly protein TadG
VDEVDQMEPTTMSQEKAVGHLPLQTAWQPETAESGQTLLEFALMLPFMMLLLLGIAELGRAIFITMAVTNAATAGAEYGSQNPIDASDINGMQKKALCDANGDVGGACQTTGILTQTPVAINGCTCDSGSGTSCNPMPASGTCTGISCAGQLVECVQVTTHADFSSLFHYPGLPQTFQANGKAVQRVRK